MTDPATGQRSWLQALKVPFDLKGVAAGALASLALIVGGRAADWPGGLLDLLDAALRDRSLRGHGDPVWSVLLLVAVGVFFGVACCRIAAVRIARDEGTDLGDAFSFSLRNIGASLGAMLFLAAAALFFAALNAGAGLLAGLPVLGPFLSLALLPLALLCGLVLFLVVFGALCGGPLVLASLAVERNGALDAVSRAFSYVFSRPVLFFFYALTVGFVAWVLGLCTIGIERLAHESFAWWLPDSGSWRALEGAVARAGDAAAAVRVPNFAGDPWDVVLWGWAAWLFGVVFHLLLLGWIQYYVFGGATAAYLALRRDVDGTEEEEIWMEGEDRDRFGEPEKPSPSAPAAGAAGAAGDKGPAPPPAKA